jgi:hypothetical protein
MKYHNISIATRDPGDVEDAIATFIYTGKGTYDAIWHNARGSTSGWAEIEISRRLSKKIWRKATKLQIYLLGIENETEI